MKPFKKILMPHDFSAHAAHAVDVAADLARRYEASLSLVHVHQPVLYAAPETFVLYPSEELSALLGAFDEQLQVAKQAALAAGAMQVDTDVLQGIAVSEILEHARTGGYDLIVMGTHGRTGLSHALIGSVAERVVRKAHCPVLTVRLVDQS